MFPLDEVVRAFWAWRAEHHGNVGRYHIGRGDDARGIDGLMRRLALCYKLEDYQGAVATHSLLAELALDCRDREEALAHASTALSVAAEHGQDLGDLLDLRRRVVALAAATRGESISPALLARRGKIMAASRADSEDTATASGEHENETLCDARAVITRAVQRKGGLLALTQIRSVQTTAVLDDGTGTELRVTIAFPYGYRVEQRIRGLVVGVTVWDGRRGQIRTNAGTFALPPQEESDVVAAVRTESIPLLLAAIREEVPVASLGVSLAVGRPAHAVRVTLHDVGDVTAYFDVAEGDHVATTYTTSRGPVTVVDSDFREVDGVRVAHAIRVTIGDTVVTGMIREVAINPTLPPDVFRL